MTTHPVRDAAPPASRFERLATWSYRRRWWALLGWLLILVAITAASSIAGSRWHNDFSLPGTESQQTLDTLRAHGAVQAGDTVQIVVHDPRGLGAADTRARVMRLLAEVGRLPHVAAIDSPYAGRDAMSADGTIGYATATLDGSAQDVPADDLRRIIDTARATSAGSLQVEVGGQPVRGVQGGGDGGAAEGAGLLAALVVLVLLFGSVLAGALPIVIAVFGVGSAIGLVVLASHVATVADYTVSLLVLVGLGVGIDYALLVFSRYRSELLAGADRERAVSRALDTAGRTVLFAGATVITALVGLVVLGLGSLQGVAVAVAVTVLVTMVAALTLLPSLLAIGGSRIERAAVRRADRTLSVEGARWRAWSAAVQARPWPAVVVAVAALLALAAPALGMRLGFADAGNDAPARTSRQAYDMLARGFGPGINGPLVVVVSGGTGPARQVATALAATPGVAEVSPPLLSRDRQVATLIAVPDSKPQAAPTQELVSRLRRDVLPPVAAATGTTVLVGGPTAATVDFAEAVAARLPLFVLVVVGLSALVLMVVFRSLLIPLKAALLNLLSVAAALGAITLVFQDGLLGGPLGVEKGPIEAFVPVMIFAIAFGLSMDYEMFLLSRMHEEWQRTSDATSAIREGMGTTGRVVTAAAAIMVVVFASFLLDPSRMLKQFGLGLAVAVLLDALVIRCLIVPAAMQLLGRHAWSLPSWLDARIPRLALAPIPFS